MSKNIKAHAEHHYAEGQIEKKSDPFHCDTAGHEPFFILSK